MHYAHRYRKEELQVKQYLKSENKAVLQLCCNLSLVVSVVDRQRIERKYMELMACIQQSCPNQTIYSDLIRNNVKVMTMFDT